MLTVPESPAGSTVEVTPTARGFRLSWRNPCGAMRYLCVAFVLFFLAGWAMGELNLVHGIIRSLKEGMGAFMDWFRMFWAVGWTLLGGLAVYLLYRLLLREMEMLELEHDTLAYTSWEDPSVDPSSPLKRAKKTVASRSELSAVRLERVGEGQRLTVDVGAGRIEVGRDLREPEREWLASVLKAWWEAR